MKALLTFTLALSCATLPAQNKGPVFYDTLGQVTTYELHFAVVAIGRYKSIHNKAEKKRTLERTTEAEFQKELKKTEKRITGDKKDKNFPAFDLVDLKGNHVTNKDLPGKVVVINFWFIGCTPCEMERPALNKLKEAYAGREDVVFLSIARNSGEEIANYTKDARIDYELFPTEKDYIKNTFEVNQYPVNIVLDKNGKYFFYGVGTGVGILDIMKKQVQGALAAE